MTDEAGLASGGHDRLAAAQRNLLQLLEHTEREREQADAVSEVMNGITGRATTPDGAITVTVDGRGLLSDIVFTNGITRRSPPRLAADLMHCVRQAQATLAEEFSERAGADPFAVRIAEGYQARFPQPMPEVGEAPRRTPGEQDDEDYFGQAGFLRPGTEGPGHG